LGFDLTNDSDTSTSERITKAKPGQFEVPNHLTQTKHLWEGEIPIFTGSIPSLSRHVP
jgi:hypothetical protein